MKWFGMAYGAPYESDTPRVPAPLHWLCHHCKEPIAQDDDGFIVPVAYGCEIALHYACHMRGIVGGVNHLRGSCTCCGGDDPPDPPNMTKRQAAIAAVKLWEQQRRQGPQS